MSQFALDLLQHGAQIAVLLAVAVIIRELRK